jgi:hypothetical protein
LDWAKIFIVDTIIIMVNEKTCNHLPKRLSGIYSVVIF